ncbi:O-antigen ligase family protein [Flavobacteriales bacterium]|nr:O-antigen ligase family protein [Flavobacteriales bacterium]
MFSRSKPSVRINSIIAVLFVITVTFALNALELGQIGTTVVIPLGFIYFFLSKRRRIIPILSIKPLFWYIFFFLFASLSILYSIDPNVAIETQLKMFIILIFTIAVFSYALNSIKAVKVLYISNIIVLFLLILYVVKLGISTEVDERIIDGVLNANTYGYYVFTGLFSLFILYSYRQNRKQKIIFSIVIVFVCFYSMLVILASASRGASIIISIVIIGNMFIINFASKKGILKKAIVLTIFSIGLFYLFIFISENYLNDSYLLRRFNNLEERETPRDFHSRKAIEIGSDHPLFGVGSGNYAVVPKIIEPGSFSHNTFTEIFANYGSIGCVIYFLMLFRVGSKILKNLNINNEKTRIINYQILFFFFMFLIYSTLYVVYLNTTFMHFLFVIYAHTLLIERNVKPYNSKELTI